MSNNKGQFESSYSNETDTDYEISDSEETDTDYEMLEIYPRLYEPLDREEIPSMFPGLNGGEYRGSHSRIGTSPISSLPLPQMEKGSLHSGTIPGSLSPRTKSKGSYSSGGNAIGSSSTSNKISESEYYKVLHQILKVTAPFPFKRPRCNRPEKVLAALQQVRLLCDQWLAGTKGKDK